MKHPNRTIGLFQASGIVLYVCLFATVTQTVSGWSAARDIQLQPILSISIFLLTFIVSAITCGSIFLAYPIKLFFSGQKDKAYKVVLWSVTWLLMFFISLLVLVFILINRF